MGLRTWIAGLGAGSLVLAGVIAAGPIAGLAGQDASPATQGEIGEDEAAAIAGEAYPEATVEGIESEDEDGRVLYEVELSNGVEVEIDAATGEIVETEEDDDAEDADEDEDDEDDEDEETGAFTDTFYLDGCEWASTGGNRFFRLEPGLQHVLQGEEDGEPVEAIITVLDETETVDGIETRVVEERETVGGELVEVSLNFFAVCTGTGGVFYFGETVDDYEDGQVVDHSGAWRVGEEENQAGLFMPAQPLLGARYYTEIAPEIALDRTEIVAMPVRAETPAGTFEGCFRAVDTSPLDPDAADEKVYCPDVGIVQDEAMVLVGFGQAETTEPAATPDNG